MRTPTSPNMLEIGLSVKALLLELEDNFPPFLSQPNDSINTIMYKSGQRSIVEWITHRLSDEEI